VKFRLKQKSFIQDCKGDNNTPRVDIDGRLYSAQEIVSDDSSKNEKKLLKTIRSNGY
jgi:hypothetical protein